ncbi:MAG: hypothetical protein WBA45_17565 [Microthrixaceae bacterium]
MRTTPHPMRVLWKTSQFVMIVSIMALVVAALGSGSRVGNGADVLVPLGWLVIFLSILTSLTERPAAQQPPALRMWPGTASVFIARPPEDVWSFIRTAETAPMIQPAVRRGFTVPGSPIGVGEQQCFISEAPHDALQAGIIEVTEEQPGRSAVARSVTGPPVSQSYEVSHTIGGTQLTYSIKLSAMRWGPYFIHPRKQVAAAAEAYAASVKRLVESQPPQAGQLAVPPPFNSPPAPPSG